MLLPECERSRFELPHGACAEEGAPPFEFERARVPVCVLKSIHNKYIENIVTNQLFTPENEKKKKKKKKKRKKKKKKTHSLGLLRLSLLPSLVS